MKNNVHHVMCYARVTRGNESIKQRFVSFYKYHDAYI